MRVVVSLLSLCLASSALAVPTRVTHSSRLLDTSGVPLEGAQTLVFRLYDAPTGGQSNWTETHMVTVNDGYFAVVLGSSTPLDSAELDGSPRYLSMAIGVGGDEFDSRPELTSAPYAIRAQTADTATQADSAITAGSASTADFATTAGSASTATTATNVSGGVVNASEIRVNNSVVVNSSGQLTQDLFNASDAVAAVADSLLTNIANSQHVRLYGLEITDNNNNPASAAPHINLTVTRGNVVASASFEIVGSPHANGVYSYSSGPKAVIYTTGNESFTFRTVNGEVYVSGTSTENDWEIRTSYPVNSAGVSSIPSGSLVVRALN